MSSIKLIMKLDNKVIYQVFVRNFSPSGTFKAVEDKLSYIHSLEADILYLMPINEIGVLNRKGTYGSPYASKDYFSISKDLGTKEDLLSLINKTHELGMKIIVDMVFNHTSPDNVLTKEHLDYYYLKNGKPGNRVGDWTDIIDLRTEDKEVQDYLLSVLKYWRSLGFDGFRFDVASIISLDFFKRARQELGEDVIFFAESISPDFAKYLKENKYYCEDDDALVPTFDVLYNYNYFFSLRNYLKSKNKDDLRKAFSIINEENNKNNGVLRSNCLENHDNERVASYFNNPVALANISALFMFIKGTIFLYAGQEETNRHKPELFEKDPVNWTGDLSFYNTYLRPVVDFKKNLSDDVISSEIIENQNEPFVFDVYLKTKNAIHHGKFDLNEDTKERYSISTKLIKIFKK